MKFLSLFCFGLLLLPTSVCLAQEQRDLHIPDVVQADKAKPRKAIPGTNAFVSVPDTYVLYKQMMRFQRDASTFIQYLNFSDSINFPARKKEFMANMQQLVGAGKISKPYYTKEFKLGEYGAVLTYAKDDKRPGMEQLVLMLGDVHFAVMMLGQIPANQLEIRKEVLAAMLSLYVDKNKKSDVFELTNYTIDLDKTSFKFAGSEGGTFLYTPGGSSLAQMESQDLVMITVLSGMQDEDEIKQYAVRMVRNLREKGVSIPTTVGKDTTLNGNPAYLINFDASADGARNTVLEIVTGNTHDAVAFMGSVSARRPDLIAQVRAIANSLKLK